MIKAPNYALKAAIRRFGSLKLGIVIYLGFGICCLKFACILLFGIC